LKHSQHETEPAWLELSQAADFLGVHFTTLRRWVDAGKVPCIRTPGGRRRFRRTELSDFLEGLRQGQSTSLTPVESPHRLAATSVRSIHLGVSDEGWYQKIDVEQRAAMRRGGQQLMAILMQYATRPNGGEPFLLEGRRLAAYYGESCRGSGLSLVETMQAFLRVRHSIFDSVYEAGSLAGLPDADTWRLYDRMNEFLDAMLLKTVEAYAAAAEGALPSPAAGS
jgi:excisionase family DNA binding protein